MAIQFFSINGAGSGGGSTVVTTANGISGDGSVANPVILGVNPINQTTTINSAGQLLTIGDPAFNEAAIEMDNTAGGQLTLSQGSDPIGIVQLSGGGVTIQTRNAASTVLSSIVLDPLTFGITINDTHNFGLVGAVLFPNGDPKQYAQYGNIVTNTAINGINILGSQIRLGGPLTMATSITAGTNSFTLNSIVSGTTAFVQLFNGILTCRASRGGDTAGLVAQATGTVLNSTLGVSQAGSVKNITFTSATTTGIPVSDTDNIGLIDAALHPISDPKQYAQYGNIPSLPSSGSGGSATTDQTIVYTPPSNGTYRINAAALNHAASADNIDITCTYTDTQTNAQSFAIQLGIIPGDASHAAPSVIQAHGGLPITLTFHVITTATYDYSGIIEKLI